MNKTKVIYYREAIPAGPTNKLVGLLRSRRASFESVYNCVPVRAKTQCTSSDMDSKGHKEKSAMFLKLGKRECCTALMHEIDPL